MYSIISNLQLGIIMDFIDKLIEVFGDVFKAVIDGFLKPIYVIFLGVCKLLDIFELIFKKLAGMDIVYLNGQAVGGDIALQLINNNMIWSAFEAMLALGSLLLFVSAFIAVVKSQLSQGQKSSVKLVIGNFIRSLINFSIVPVLCFAGIYFGNHLLQAIDAATNQTGASTISSRLFLCASYDANRARDAGSSLYKNYIGPEAESDANTFGIFKDSSSNGTAATAIDQAFVNEIRVNGVMEFNFFHEFLVGNPFAGVASMLGWMSAISSVPDSGESGTVTFSIYNVGLVCIYYNLGSFSYLIGIGAGIILLGIFLDLIFGMVKRLYMLVTLFIIVPPLIGIIPIDEGRALQGWKQQFVGNTISAYGAVVAINVYLMLITVFQGLELFQLGSNAAVKADEIVYVEAASSGSDMQALANLGITVANNLCQVFIIIGGAYFLKQISGEISRIIGANDAMAEGGAVANKIKSDVKKGAMVAATVATAGAGAIAAKGKALGAMAKAGAQRIGAYVNGENGGVQDTSAKVEETSNNQSSKDKSSNGGKSSDNKFEGGEQLQLDLDGDGGVKEPSQEKEKKNPSVLGKIARGAGKAVLGVGKAAGFVGGAVLKTANFGLKAAAFGVKAGINPIGTALSLGGSAVKGATNGILGVAGAGARLYAKKKKGMSDDQIAQIESQYREQMRDANRYDPVKNPIQARINGMKEKAFQNTLKGLTPEDAEKVRRDHVETKGRREAMKERTKELQDDYKIAKSTGNAIARMEARENLENYMRAIKHGLDKNEAYWQQEAAFQKRMADFKSDIAKVQNELSIARATGQGVAEANKKLADLQSTMGKFARSARPKP